MHDTRCPKCGHDSAVHSGCPAGEQGTVNGVAKPGRVTPPPPPEAAGWVITPTPADELERLRLEFNEEEWLAVLHEVETTGGVPIDDVIAKIERNVYGDR